jgi:AAA domain
VNTLNADGIATPGNLIRPATLDEIIAVKQKHALRNHRDTPGDAGAETRFIVDGLIPQRQLGVLVGNSGLGKSPALYQLGLCAAAGIPFLGDQTVESDVLYFDFENGAGESRLLEARIATYLGLPLVPEHFLRWNADDCAASFNKPGQTVEDIICDWAGALAGTGRAKLVLVDPLRYWLTHIEDARYADAEIQRARRVIRDTGATIQGVHHLRRVSAKEREGIPDLEVNPRAWIHGMSRGAVALINGSDVRLGFDAPACNLNDKVSIVLAGFRRVRGQIGPIYLERVISNEDGEPLGYCRVASVEMLGQIDHIEAFKKFAPRFTFTDAVTIFGKSDSATDHLLKKCLNLKLLRKEGRWYVKTAA